MWWGVFVRERALLILLVTLLKLNKCPCRLDQVFRPPQTSLRYRHTQEPTLVIQNQVTGWGQKDLEPRITTGIMILS